MANRVFGEGRRPRVAQSIADQIIFRHLPDGADALMPNIFEIVEAFFKFAAALLLRRFRKCLRAGLARFPNAPSREPELVPPDLPRFDSDIALFRAQTTLT